MQKHVIKDARSNILGYIEERGDGIWVGKDARQNIKGYYDPKTNKTKDFGMNIVGSGNLLSMLITGR